MTVVYNHEVSTVKTGKCGLGLGFGNFSRLLWRWRGSIYKVVLPDLFIYGLLYAVISLIYRFALKQDEFLRK
jgi:hypothetical protein